MGLGKLWSFLHDVRIAVKLYWNAEEVGEKKVRGSYK